MDALKKALGLNHKRDKDEFMSYDNDDFTTDNSSSNCDSDATRNNKTNNIFSKTQSKGLPGEKSLPDKYFCEGLPTKLMMEALKELNINDIKDFLMAGGPEKTVQFEKKKKTRATSTVSLRVKSWQCQGSFNSLPTSIIFWRSSLKGLWSVV